MDTKIPEPMNPTQLPSRDFYSKTPEFTRIEKPSGTSWRPRPRNAPNEPSESPLWLFGTRGQEIIQKEPCGAQGQRKVSHEPSQRLLGPSGARGQEEPSGTIALTLNHRHPHATVNVANAQRETPHIYFCGRRGGEKGG